jgi:hypothetical protein
MHLSPLREVASKRSEAKHFSTLDSTLVVNWANKASDPSSFIVSTGSEKSAVDSDPC